MAVFGVQTEAGYGALIGDVVRSRRLPDRAASQRELQAAIANANREWFPSALAAPLTLTAGDEVQALFHRPEASVAVVRTLSDALAPGRMAFGLGWGALTTDLVPDPAVLDGPCFHAAREALGRAQKQELWVVTQGFGFPADDALSALFGLLGAVRSRWTATQARYVAAARGALQKDVAARFGVSPSVVSESLAAASFHVVTAGETATERLLVRFGSAGPSARNAT